MKDNVQRVLTFISRSFCLVISSLILNNSSIASKVMSTFLSLLTSIRLTLDGVMVNWYRPFAKYVLTFVRFLDFMSLKSKKLTIFRSFNNLRTTPNLEGGMIISGRFNLFKFRKL